MLLLDSLIGILFTGAAYAMVLYVISVGLSVTMGLLGIANLAHGAFAMAGGYLLGTLMERMGVPYSAGIVLAAAVVAAISLVLERLLYARVYKSGEFDQVLLSIGLIFIASAVAHMVYGPLPKPLAAPQALSGGFDIGIRTIPVFRTAVIVLGILIYLSLVAIIEWTAIGIKIRAAVDNRTMAEGVGVNTRVLYSSVFAFGSALAAIGGAIGADMIPITPDYPLEHLAYFLIVVAVGGLGTVTGPFVAALLLGIGDSACKILAPQFGAFFIYIAVFGLLLARPGGLFNRVQGA